MLLENDLRYVPLSRAETLAQKLEQTITEQKRQPGDFIGTLADLQSSSGFAAATVSSAVKLLRERGVMEIRPGRDGGLFVANPTPVVKLRHTMLTIKHSANSVHDALEVREALENLVAKDAAENRTDADLEDLREILSRLAETGNSVEQFMRTNWELHARIAAISPNQLTKTLYLGLLEFVKSETTEFGPDDTAWQENFAYRIGIHANLVTAIASGDIQEVSRAVLEHNA